MEEPDAFGSDAAFTLLAREELEELVRDRTEALENVMDTMVDVLLKLGPEGNIQLANAAVESRLGYDPDDVTGKPIDHLLADPGQADDAETLTGTPIWAVNPPTISTAVCPNRWNWASLRSTTV